MPLLLQSCVLPTQASISPGDSGLVTVVGTGILRMFKLAEQTLKPLPLNANRRDMLTFTCQAWVPLGDKGGDGANSGAAGDASKGGAGSDRERQLLGTVDGEILLFEVRRVCWYKHLCATCVHSLLCSMDFKLSHELGAVSTPL